MVETWIADIFDKNSTIRVDPWCLLVDTRLRWEKAFMKNDHAVRGMLLA